MYFLKYILVLIVFLIFKISYFIVDVNQQNFYSILLKKKYEKMRGLENFYLSFKDPREFFHNDLYLILHNKKFIIYLFVKHFYQIKMIN